MEPTVATAGLQQPYRAGCDLQLYLVQKRRNFYLMLRWILLAVALCISCRSVAQQQLHWTHVYTYTDEQQFLGQSPTYAHSIRHDRMGRREAMGIERNGDFFPTTFWEYDADGHETVERVVDSAGNAILYKRCTYDAAGHLRDEFQGTSAADARRVWRYIWENDRWKSIERIGQADTVIGRDDFVYDATGRLLQTHRVIDGLMDETVDNGTYTFDSLRQKWTHTIDYGNGAKSFEVCADARCSRFLEATYYGIDGKMMTRTLREFDAHGNETFSETVDSANRWTTLVVKEYNRYGHLTNQAQQTMGMNAPGTVYVDHRDAQGRLVSTGYEDAQGKEILTAQYVYDARGRCIKVLTAAFHSPDETQYVYDDQDRLLRKTVVQHFIPMSVPTQIVWQPALPLPEPLAPPEPPQPSRPPKKQKHQPTAVPEPRAHTDPPQDDTGCMQHYGYTYDVDDSIAEVYLDGIFTPCEANGDGMPSGIAPAGTYPWLLLYPGIMDTLERAVSGDTVILSLSQHHDDDGYPRDTTPPFIVRKSWELHGELIQVVEFSKDHEVAILWRHRDWGKASGVEPILQEKRRSSQGAYNDAADAFLRSCTIRTYTERHTSRWMGDTLIRTRHSIGDAASPTECAYLHGRLVWQKTYLNWGGVHTARYTYDPAGILLEEYSSGAVSPIRTVHNYDVQGRLMRTTTFFSGQIQSQFLYSYPDPTTTRKAQVPTVREARTVYRFVYW